MTTTVDIDALTALEAAATAAPWRDAGHGDMTAPNGDTTPDGEYQRVAFDVRQHDLAFIATSRNALPRLIAEVRRLRDDQKQIAGMIEMIRSGQDEREKLLHTKWSEKQLAEFVHEFASRRFTDADHKTLGGLIRVAREAWTKDARELEHDALLAEVRRLRDALAVAADGLAFVEPIAAQFTKRRPLQGDELHRWELVVDVEPAVLTQTHIHKAAAALRTILVALADPKGPKP